MATSQATVPLRTRQVPPVVLELQSVFEALADGDPLAALTGPTRRGPKGYPVAILWRCFIARYVMGLDSVCALLRALHDNPYLARVCGIGDSDSIPSQPTMSRFFAKMAHDQVSLRMVKDVSRRSLNHTTVRRRRKVTMHCYLSLIAMQASPSALGAT